MELVLSFGLGFLVILAAIAYGLKQKKRNQDRKIIGLQWLVLMRQLIDHFQRHRGLANAFLNGDKAIATDIQSLQASIEGYVQQIEKVDEKILQNSEWMSIKAHWSRLSRQYQTIGLQNSLDQHGKLISNTLYLVEEIADQSDLIKVKGIEQYGYDFIWKDLLESIEYMGQLRALGTGIAASGHCSSVQRIRLNYLKDKVSSVIAHLETFVIQNPNEKALITHFVDTVETEIINKEQLTLSSQEYFKMASQAIDSIYSEYDRIIANIKVV